MTVLQERYREVSDRIGKLVLQAGREPHSVSLIAVSKTFPSDGIREVYAAGQRDFGENYIQEWYGKTERKRRAVSMFSSWCSLYIVRVKNFVML